MFWVKLISLCNEKEISPNKLCSDLGFSNAIATKWKNGALPRSTTMKKIADYFGITIDELLSDDPVRFLQKEKSINSGELCEAKIRELYAIYSALSPERQRQVDEYLAFMRSQQDD